MEDNERRSEHGHEQGALLLAKRRVEERAHEPGEDDERQLLAGDFGLLLEEVVLADQQRGGEAGGAARERPRGEVEHGDGEDGEQRRVYELEDPHVLAADEAVQRGRQDRQAEHCLVRVEVPGMPDAGEHRLVEVEVLAADVVSDDVGAAHAREQHRRQATAIDHHREVLGVHPRSEQHSGGEDHHYRGEDPGGEGVATTVIEPSGGGDRGDRQKQWPQPTCPLHEVGAPHAVRRRRVASEDPECRRDDVDSDEERQAV